MPQTMPMNWLSLYFFILILFILINIKMFYNLNNYPMKNNKFINKNFNWKW
uniref:ATP synthase F0 subunit 8 n=1 Tax=Hippodamia undecimnotata TaxID=703263 RepID=A0A343C313_9CUCU|nr:ATP synthase F0 subunit 8 [Hippodamia undecimnotata]